MRSRKGFKNVNISNGLFFLERCLISATVCANKFSALTRHFVCTHRRSYKTTSFEKRTIDCLRTFDPEFYFIIKFIDCLTCKSRKDSLSA